MFTIRKPARVRRAHATTRTAVLAASMALATAATAAEWSMVNHDPSGAHFQPDETAISAANVGRLAPRWTLTVAGTVNATPAVVDGAVYVPDSGGRMWKIDARSGSVIWSAAVPKLTGIDGAFSRTSPAYADGLVFVAASSGANLIAIDANTGQKRWMTQLDAHPAALLTSSPVVAGDRIYMPVSSNEQTAAGKPGYPCCTFRGSLVALDIHTGEIVWKTYTMPDNGGEPGGFSGGAALGIPAVDVGKRLIYFATNHQYSQPDSVTACLTAEPNDWKRACYPADARFSSIIALDLDTGQPKWSTFGAGPEIYQLACGPLPVSWRPMAKDYAGGGAGRICPPAGDFLSWSFATGSPHLFRIGGRDVVGIGQKSGVYWAFDAVTGEVIWHSLVGPYSEPGGVTWGAANDGQRIYVTLTNADHTPFKLASGKITDGGFWTALDPASGRVIWQTAEPGGALVYASPAVANGVVYVASLAATGDQMYALDAATGSILWQFDASGSVGAHPAVVDHAVVWGSGLAGFPGAARNDKVYLFSVDGK